MWNAVPWAFIKLHKHLLSTQSLPGAILRTKDAETKMYISSGPLTGAQRPLGKLRCEQVATGRHEPPQVSVCRSGGHTDKDLQTPPRKKRWRLKFSRMTKSIVLGEGGQRKRDEGTWVGFTISRRGLPRKSTVQNVALTEAKSSGLPVSYFWECMAFLAPWD